MACFLIRIQSEAVDEDTEDSVSLKVKAGFCLIA